MAGPVAGSPTIGIFSDIVLNPALWRWLLFAGQPVRLAIAANVVLGRSIRSMAYDLARRLNNFIAWLYGRSIHHRLRSFEARYFPVRRWHVVAAGLVAIRAVHLVVRLYTEHTSGRMQKRRALQTELSKASSHTEWLDVSMGLLRLSGTDPVAQAARESYLYDKRLLVERTKHLRRVREKGDAVEMMFALRSDLLRNLGNMANAALHEQLLLVPPAIREYTDEARDCLRYVAQAPSLTLDDRLAFLRETRHAYGRTALVLSGGGSFGSFHLGVVKALLDDKLLPRVLSGSSAGAIVAALICTRTDEELDELFAALPERLQGIDFYSSNNAFQILRHLVMKGTLQDHRVLQERLQRLLGDVTFQEAYARSGRILNVSVSAADTREPPRLLNYLTAPNVIVYSAVSASSAFPFLFAPQLLMARDARGFAVPFSHQMAGDAQRRWRDGSLEEDLPMRGLSEMFNVNYFLVSQCNPYLLPIIAAKAAVPRTLGTLAEQEFKHRCKQLMELLPRQIGASRVLKLLSQPWEGDVTMVLPATTLSAVKAVVNLSREDLTRALSEGQRATWAKLSSISANCNVEVTLDACLRQVTAAARRARVRLHRRASSTVAGVSVLQGSVGGEGGMRRGIPSWLHLQSLGIPRASSLEGLGIIEDESPVLPGKVGLGASTAPPIHIGARPIRNVHSVRSVPSMLQLDLTDTIVPEDAELSMNGSGALQGDHQLGSFGEGEEEEEEGGAHGDIHPGDSDFERGVLGGSDSVHAAMPDSNSSKPNRPRFMSSASQSHLAARMSMGCGDDVWKDLFELAPASMGGEGLDFIAP